MKAKIRKTGEIVNIAEYSKITLDQCDSWGNPIELKPEEVELIQEQTEDEHWQNVIEQKAKAYDKALESIKKLYSKGSRVVVSKEEFEIIFPELAESEDERIRKEIIELVKFYYGSSLTLKHTVSKDEMVAWLEKQGNTNDTTNRTKFTQAVLRGAAINLITWIDYNAAEGNTCLSNIECKDIEDALVRGDWDKIYGYIKKKLEKN